MTEQIVLVFSCSVVVTFIEQCITQYITTYLFWLVLFRGIRMRGGVDALQRRSAIYRPFWVINTVQLFSNMSLIVLNAQWTYWRQVIGIADSFSVLLTCFCSWCWDFVVGGQPDLFPQISRSLCEKGVTNNPVIPLTYNALILPMGLGAAP